jgi:hypothetical protein
MLDTSRSLRPANGAIDAEGRAHVAGLVAAAVWAIGAAAGIAALLIGQAGLAIAALFVAVVAPWVGLACVSHAHHDSSAAASVGREFAHAHLFWGS